jgi:branched-chain amino acid transport system permease protein
MKLLAVSAVLILLAGAPWLLGSNYALNMATQILIAALFASSLNLLLGYGGLFSFGHNAVFGGAAYLGAIALTRYGLSPAATAAIVLAGVLLLSAIIGVIALRATGIGLAMITLALGQVAWGIAYRWVGMTNGENGIGGIQRPTLEFIDLNTARNFFWVIAACTVLLLWLLKRLIDSPYGACLRGTRDQPRRMSALGHDVWLVRWLAFLYAGVLAGIAGLMFLYYHRFVSPQLLSLGESAEVLLMVVSGGPGTFAGPLVGAALVLLIKNVASSYIESWQMLLGVMFLLVVVATPDGLVPGFARLWWGLRSRLGHSWIRARTL